ncbi:MAG TPA: glycosyltransferase family 39 protein [Candidatus Polarisedimenticolia bacterium]|nr:glycosyltransferase family 39 protein [Candidatus Polarisedimenticolia bacterium]
MTQERPGPLGASGAGPVDLWERRAVPAALALLAALLVQGLIFIGESSQTSDEAAHLAAGYSYLKAADFRLNPEHPPLIKEWAALPLLLLHLKFPWGPLWEQSEEWNIGRIFVHENLVPNDTLLLLGRLPILLLSLALGWFLFLWGRALFGPRGALLGLALYVFDPNVVAHSSLITTDLGLTLFIFLAVYALWIWSERPSPGPLVLCGLMVGGAFASKFTSFWILPILFALLVLLFFWDAPLPLRPWRRRDEVTGPQTARRALGLLLLAVCLALLTLVVVVGSYAGTGVMQYLVGLERGLRHSGVGHKAYLLGQYSEAGWWWYFLYAYLIKTPIGTLLLVQASLAALLLGRRIRFKEEFFLWVPIAVIVLITCVWRVNIGLRHILPIYPFLYLSAGRLAMRPGTGAPAPRRWPAALAAGGIVACLIWNVLSAWRITPYQLAYFNELIGGPANGHLHLLDSNLDWGQASKALRRYVESENLPIIYCAFSGNTDPWYYGVRYQYAPGSGNLDVSKDRPVRLPEDAPREVLVVSAMVLHSVQFSDTDVWAPLRKQTPIATPGYAFLAYDITRNADAHAYLAALYLSFGMSEFAEYEASRTLKLEPSNSLARSVLDAVGGRTTLPGEPPQ